MKRSLGRSRPRRVGRSEPLPWRGVLEQALRVLQEGLADADRLDWSRVIVDASLVEAKKGARRSRARFAAGPGAATNSPRRQRGAAGGAALRWQPERATA